MLHFQEKVLNSHICVYLFIYMQIYLTFIIFNFNLKNKYWLFIMIEGDLLCHFFSFEFGSFGFHYNLEFFFNKDGEVNNEKKNSKNSLLNLKILIPNHCSWDLFIYFLFIPQIRFFFGQHSVVFSTILRPCLTYKYLWFLFLFLRPITQTNSIPHENEINNKKNIKKPINFSQ